MNRYAIENVFGIQGFNIAWYGVIIATGMILSAAIAAYRSKKQGYKTDLIYDFMLLALPISIICARLYYVIFEWDSYASNPMKIFAIREGGLAIYGGVIGGIICALIFCKVNKFPFLKLADLAIPSLVLGQSIGRWGNFVNQEAYGNLVTNPKLQFFPYAVYIDAIEEWHQATFFYESMWNLILFIILLVVLKRVKKSGYAIPIYFIGYGLGRTLIEGLRADSLYILPGVRVSQLLSMILMVVGAVIWLMIRKSKYEETVYEGKYAITTENDMTKTE